MPVDQKTIKLLEILTAQLGACIKRSFSGSKFKVERPLLSAYECPEYYEFFQGPVGPDIEIMQNFQSVTQNKDSKVETVAEAFKSIIYNHVGDCKQQSLILSISLLSLKSISDSYNIYLSTIALEKMFTASYMMNHYREIMEMAHTFIVLLPKDVDLKDEYNTVNIFYTDGAIIIDPFINRVFTNESINENLNPISTWNVAEKNYNYTFEKFIYRIFRPESHCKKFLESSELLIETIIREIINSINSLKENREKELLIGFVKEKNFEALISFLLKEKKYFLILKNIIINAVFLGINLSFENDQKLSYIDLATEYNNIEAAQLLRDFSPHLAEISKGVKHGSKPFNHAHSSAPNDKQSGLFSKSEVPEYMNDREEIQITDDLLMMLKSVNLSDDEDTASSEDDTANDWYGLHRKKPAQLADNNQETIYEKPNVRRRTHNNFFTNNNANNINVLMTEEHDDSFDNLDVFFTKPNF